MKQVNGSMFRRILPHIQGARATGGQAPSVRNGVRWRRPSFNETKRTLQKVCETCQTNGSSMLKCSGCKSTYYCSPECQKEAWKYHKSACKNLKNDGGFDRDTHNNIKCGLNLNINSKTFKDSIVYTSGCKYWRIDFDHDDKDDTYMMLIESSKDEFIDAYGEEVNGFNGEDIKFYYIINNKLYCISCCN